MEQMLILPLQLILSHLLWGVAAEKGHTEIVEKLISAGAVINYQNKLWVLCPNTRQ
ncbi:hypothetical protein GBAR_LOCUS30243, partial [Geodia barretti]